VNTSLRYLRSLRYCTLLEEINIGMVKNSTSQTRPRGVGSTPHYRRLDQEMKTLHAKAMTMDRKNMTMKQKRDHDWKQFERLGGGKRPTPRHKFTEHLRRVRNRKQHESQDLTHERRTGEFDLVRGSAAVKRRARAMSRRHGVEKKLKLEARKMGNPHVLYRAGKLDFGSQTLNLSHKMPRKIERAVAQEKDVGDRRHRQNWHDDYDVNQPRGGRILHDCNDLSLNGFGPKRSRAQKRN